MSLISYLTSFQKNGIENNWLTEETPLLLPPSSPYNTPSSSSPSSPSHTQQYPRKNSYNKRFLNKHVLHLAISVPHKSQLQDWDCGLACASMVKKNMKFVEEYFEKRFVQHLVSHHVNPSIC